MLLARVTFTPLFEHEEAELVAAAEAYLGALAKNGQICGDHLTGWHDGDFCAYAYLSHRNAVTDRFLSKWGRRDRETVRRQFGCDPVWEILDDDAAVRVSSWKSASSLYLFTHAFDLAGPVVHGDRGTAIPLHLLPVTDRQRERLCTWADSYTSHDRIWFESAALEVSAYEQLADPNSDLCDQGRTLCREVEDAVKRPVFFYLLKHWGEFETEKNRLCPGCGQNWVAPSSPAPSREPFRQFHFRCYPCRLVSHRAVAFDDPERAAIGTYTPG